MIVNSYERNLKARSECIKEYGVSCTVCGFNFEETYGKRGKGFIHVHHIVPISDIGDEYQVDPIRDLRPVCPNCHAMLHRKGNISIKELLSEIISN
ncbi:MULTISPECIES: HNH endonuclease [unclassified Pseudoalteromonas]|uniref:HNH endonuclease n=1 Tax=unclassified Pseudoalteromonas TaxID=194690 RepID=UPI00308104A1